FDGCDELSLAMKIEDVAERRWLWSLRPRHSIQVRMARLSLFAQVSLPRVRHDGGRNASTLALPQPFAGLLTAHLSLPMCCVLGVARQNQSGRFTHLSILRRTTMTCCRRFLVAMDGNASNV